MLFDETAAAPVVPAGSGRAAVSGGLMFNRFSSSDPGAHFKQNRSMALDSIRAGAILAVLVYHVASRYDVSSLDPLAQFFRRYGLLGVDIFFPLSGYLITGFLLRRSDTESIKVFFLRRVFRIIPLYMVAVTLFLFASLSLGYDQDTVGRIWINYLFLTGWMIFFDGPETIPYTITWSLSVEEFAYILFGLAAWVLRRNFLAFLILISIASMALRLHLNLAGFEAVYNFPPARIDSIGIGGIVAVCMQRKLSGPQLMATLLALAVMSYIFVFWDPMLWSSLKYTFIALVTCLLIVLFENRYKTAQSRVLSWISAIGFYSYFTYLFHMFNIELLLKLPGIFQPTSKLSFWGVVVAALLITQVQAVLSFRFFEGPLMRYGRELEQRKQTPPVAAHTGKDVT